MKASLPEEVIKRVRQIEVATRKSVDDLMGGSYKSHFKGHGVQFSEHRQYVPGDDVRHIDWKVSARSREPLIKKYEEERELTVFIIVDMSQSKNFGSQVKLKSELAAEIGGLLSFAAINSGDKVGLLLFAGKNEKIVPPKRGKQHVLRMIQDILTFEPKTFGTNLKGALESTQRLMKHKGIIFVISDFRTMPENLATESPDFERSLKQLAKKHDVVCINIGDEREETVPELGTFYFQNPETGETSWVDTRSKKFQDWLLFQKNEVHAKLNELFRQSRCDVLKVQTHMDYLDCVVSFFRKRHKMKGRR